MIMFTTSCFIRKNSQNICDKLEKIGYKQSLSYEGDLVCLIAECDSVFGPEYREANEGAPILYMLPKKIDCGYNEELFLAIAALRDDCDYMQWFVMDVEIYVNIPKGTWFKATNREGGYHIGTQINPFYCHKATVEELIEHFKNRL